METTTSSDDVIYSVDITLSQDLLRNTSLDSLWALRIIGDFDSMSAAMICTFLWETKRYLSYPLTMSTCQRIVIVIAENYNVKDKSFFSLMGLSVRSSPLSRSGLDAEGIDHMQHALLQTVRSALLADRWFLFVRPDRCNDFGTFARRSLHNSRDLFLDVCSIETGTLYYQDGIFKIRFSVSSYRGLETPMISVSEQQQQQSSAALMFCTGEEVEITGGKSLNDMITILQRSKQRRKPVFLTEFDKANMSRGYSSYLPTDTSTCERYWKYFAGANIYAPPILLSGTSLPEEPSSSDKEYMGAAVESDLLFDDEDTSLPQMETCPLLCEVKTASGPRIVPLSALTDCRFYEAPRQSIQRGREIAQSVVCSLSHELQCQRECQSLSKRAIFQHVGNALSRSPRKVHKDIKGMREDIGAAMKTTKSPFISARELKHK